MKRGAIIGIAIIIIMLVAVVLVSAVFYLNFATGFLGPTGHVILNTKDRTLENQANESFFGQDN